MGIGSFFGRLLATADASKPEGQTAPEAITPPAPTAPSAPIAAPALLQREEILDRRNRLLGYRFSLRHSDDQPADNTEALLRAFAAADVRGFAERRLTVLPVPPSLPVQQMKPLAGKNTVFLLGNGDASPLSAAVLRPQLEAMQAAELKAAVDLSAVDDLNSLLPLLDTVFADLRTTSLTALPRIVSRLKTAAPALRFAASGTASWAEKRMADHWGFDFCLGYFPTESEAENTQDSLDNSKASLIILLNHLQNDDATVPELAEVAKRDPDITFQLLKLANSPAVGLNSPASSIEQAIVVLGRAPLYRWLLVAMFRVGKGRDRDEALLELALTRARFLETVAGKVLDRKGCDELFLVGLLSTLDVLLAMPLAKILSQIQVTPAVRSVLLDSEGPLARFLLLAMAMERGRAEQAQRLANDLGISIDTLESASLNALRWAESAMSGEA
ncbi:MAG: HDOD domain-containing protein [Zoogloeaceae bacterium]|nr:HDOD domain-containing protein [Zoogloeaceae bacterium]